MVDEVEGLWRTIVEWVRGHAPATAASIRPPAADRALSSVVTAVGKPLPADLQRWWQLADGITVGVLDALIPPISTPLPIADGLEIRQFSLSLKAELADKDDDEVDNSAQVASASCYGFHPLFVPIAEDHCGETMFVDLREGLSTVA